MELPSKNKSFEENAAIVLIFIAFGYFLIRLVSDFLYTHKTHQMNVDIREFDGEDIWSKELDEYKIP